MDNSASKSSWQLKNSAVQYSLATEITGGNVKSGPVGQTLQDLWIQYNILDQMN